MENKLKQLVKEAESKISKIDNINEFNVIRSKFLGKNSVIVELSKTLRDLDNEQKPIVGKLLNIYKNQLENIFLEKNIEIKNLEINKKINKDKIDPTLEIDFKRMGSLHPCTLVINQVIEIFTSLGFSIKDGPEIETDFFNFVALNIPKDHPARDMQDTFYVGDDLLLRTQTSPIQIREMLNNKPPLKIITPGRVYRPDDDASHSPMFQQIEGLVVDKNVTMADLKGVLELFAKKLFDENTQIRLRPSHFPFTEPSVEVDVTCAICHGSGCRLCKSTGWIEILGAGIVNPKVLENVGINSNKYKGFAFGLGVERIAMIKYQIPDIRMLFKNDDRFLRLYSKEI